MIGAVVAAIVWIALALAACTTLQPGIQPEAIDGLVRAVADRHDAYVTADETLDPYDRATYLRSTEILRQVLDAAKRQP